MTPKSAKSTLPVLSTRPRSLFSTFSPDFTSPSRGTPTATWPSRTGAPTERKLAPVFAFLAFSPLAAIWQGSKCREFTAMASSWPKSVSFGSFYLFWKAADDMKLKEAAKLTLPSLALFTPRFQMDRLQFKKPNFLEPKSSFRFISKKKLGT